MKLNVSFPPVKLSMDDIAAIEHLASDIVDDTLAQYQEHATQNSIVTETRKKRWKVIRQRENVTVYQDMTEQILRTSNGSASNVYTSWSPLSKKKQQVVLAVGTCSGDLDDLMFGALNATTDMMRIKSAYTGDGLTDCAILASIITPTPHDPLRELQVKWSLSGESPWLMRPWIRRRDFVYVESTGIIIDKHGQRIGYNLVHSIDIPGIRELKDHQIVRARLSICSLFRQASTPEVVELYSKGFVDPMGNIHASIALGITADSLLSFRRTIHCAKMKKLNWMLSNEKPILSSERHQRVEETCIVCAKHWKNGSLYKKKKSCRICNHTVCHKCRLQETLCFVSSMTCTVTHTRMTLCRLCVLKASHVNALSVAIDELHRTNPFVAYEGGSFLTSSSPSSSSVVESLINSDRFDSKFFA